MLDRLAGWANVRSVSSQGRNQRRPSCSSGAALTGSPSQRVTRKRVYVEGGVTDRHRDGSGVVDVDPEFFEAFPPDGLVRQLARLDMSADEVPAVEIPPTRLMAMHQKH